MHGRRLLSASVAATVVAGLTTFALMFFGHNNLNLSLPDLTVLFSGSDNSMGRTISVSGVGATSNTPSAQPTSVPGGYLSLLSAQASVDVAASSGFDETLSIDIADATQSTSGYKLTATATSFTNPNNSSDVLPSWIVVPNSPSVICDTGAYCSPGGGPAYVNYPYAVPLGSPMPPATNLFVSSSSNTNNVDAKTIISSINVGNVHAPNNSTSYQSTFILTLASAP